MINVPTTNINLPVRELQKRANKAWATASDVPNEIPDKRQKTKDQKTKMDRNTEPESRVLEGESCVC